MNTTADKKLFVLAPRVSMGWADGAEVEVPSLSEGVCDYCHHDVGMVACFCGKTVRHEGGFAEVAS